MIVCNTKKELTNATNVNDAAGAVAVKEYVAEHAGGDLTPSTTVTVSGVEKTLQAYVEDIAEDQAQIYVDEKFENKLLSDITSTNVTGELTLGRIYRYGNIIFMGFSFTNAENVSVGNNVVSANITGLPVPITVLPSAIMYSGSTGYVAALNNNVLTVRVIGADHTAGNTVYGTLIMLVSD